MKKEKVVATLAMGVVAGGVAVGGTSTVHAETLDENTENTVQAPEETEAPADPETKEEAKDQLDQAQDCLMMRIKEGIQRPILTVNCQCILA